ncbi:MULTISPECIES: universal stress protein [Massilia]|uniref:Universal stress protein n=1 Tax=Massilia haematophila TaxID=457923 RepID=A0ABV7PI98_9BURK|nr:universal stress protein [Massilia sp.]
MNAFERIIAATDLSAPARHAAERAALVCKETAARLGLVHVADFGPLDRLRGLLGTAAPDMGRQVIDGAQLVLLRAYDVPFEGYMRYASVDEESIRRYRLAAEREARTRMDALCAGAGLAPADALPVVLHGDPILRIVEQEQECDCDLVVMGKHGAHLAERLLLGSATSHILDESAGDVLVSL